MPSQTVKPANRVMLAAILLSVGFIGLATILPLGSLIIVLNAAFAGSAAALVVAYWTLLKNAVLGVSPYSRVRQMTLGFALCWVAYTLTVSFSIYARSSGFDVNSSYVTATSRYIAIIAAILQVTSPDFGLGIFHGRDRKMLWTCLAIGLAVAALAIGFQDYEVLSNLPEQTAGAG